MCNDVFCLVFRFCTVVNQQVCCKYRYIQILYIYVVKFDPGLVRFCPLYILSFCSFPGKRTHDLVVASTILCPVIFLLRCCVCSSVFSHFKRITNTIRRYHMWDVDVYSLMCAYVRLCFHRERGYSISKGFVWIIDLDGQLQISCQPKVKWVSGQSHNRHDQPRTYSILNKAEKYGHYMHRQTHSHKHNVLLDKQRFGLYIERKWRIND